MKTVPGARGGCGGAVCGGSLRCVCSAGVRSRLPCSGCGSGFGWVRGGGSVLHGNQPLSKPRFWNPCGLCVVSVKVGDR